MPQPPAARLTPEQRRTHHTNAPPMLKLHRNAALGRQPAQTHLTRAKRQPKADQNRAASLQGKRMLQPPTARLAPGQRRTHHTNTFPMLKLHRNATLVPRPAHTHLIRAQSWPAAASRKTGFGLQSVGAGGFRCRRRTAQC